MVIKRIGVLKLATFQAVLMAVFGLLALLFVSMFTGLVGAAGGHAGLAGMFGMAGAMMFIIMPIFYAAIGFVSGAVGALLYNLVASFIGGIEIDVE